jgi:hypothetical protein
VLEKVNLKETGLVGAEFVGRAANVPGIACDGGNAPTRLQKRTAFYPECSACNGLTLHIPIPAIIVEQTFPQDVPIGRQGSKKQSRDPARCRGHYFPDHRKPYRPSELVVVALR